MGVLVAVLAFQWQGRQGSSAGRHRGCPGQDQRICRRAEAEADPAGSQASVQGLREDAVPHLDGRWVLEKGEIRDGHADDVAVLTTVGV